MGVFTGDFVDRGPDPQSCYRLSEELATKTLPRRVTRLLGNHEWMNIAGLGPKSQFAQYVSKEDLGSFGGWKKRQESWLHTGEMGKLVREGFEGVTIEQIPGVPLSRSLFVHAGMKAKTLELFKYGGTENPVLKMQKKVKEELLAAETEGEDGILRSSILNEILQTRHLAQGKEAKVCPELDQILKIARAERLVVGHTPTSLIGAKNDEPLVRCGGRMLLTDVAMSRWMGGGRASALVMQSDSSGELASMEFLFGDGKGVPSPMKVPILPTLVDYTAEERGELVVEEVPEEEL